MESACTPIDGDKNEANNEMPGNQEQKYHGHLKEVFLDFANNTTLHGLKYITKAGLRIVERLFWLMIFITSVSMSLYFIYCTWWKWRTSPIIVSFSEKYVPVEMIPFPSVTICPQVKFKQSRFNYTNVFMLYKSIFPNPDENETAQETRFNYTKDMEINDAVTMLCDTPTSFSDAMLTDASAVQHILDMSPAQEDIFIECTMKWSKYKNCAELFFKVLTQEGVCYNLNSLAVHEILKMESLQQDYTYMSANITSEGWTLENGYISEDPYAYPGRGRENGGVPDLHIELYSMEEDKDRVCGKYSGYKVFLHHPADLPHSSLYYFAALPQQLSSLALRFTMVTTSEELKNYPIKTRQCYFPDDKPLRYFLQYTFNNCRLECLSNFTFKSCGCVAFYMPHNNSKEICSANKMECVTDAQATLAGLQFKEKEQECLCLPACNYIDYDADIHKTSFDSFVYDHIIYHYTPFNGSYYNLPKLTYTQIDLFFRESMYMAVHRSELFGVADFLADCGGLLGLFYGFSILSLVEIIYYSTFRTFCTIKMESKKDREKT
ncbi:hypothetical protein ACJJTC_018625, partial [Scirpophaga incertulas]